MNELPNDGRAFEPGLNPGSENPKARHPHKFRRRAAVVAGVAIGAGLALYAYRQVNQPIIAPGCQYADLALPAAGTLPLATPSEVRSAAGVLEYSLDVRYADNAIGGCKAHLRSYNGRLTAETWRIKPGDTLRIALKNSLPASHQGSEGSSHAMHAGYDGTNLHTHGLHVSSAGNEDNPFVNVRAGDVFQYEIHVPKDHPSGTFWYHPHLHGATAVQQSSGMSGALIVEGGLDDVPEIKAAKEQVLVLQQISYDQSGKLEDFNEAFGPGAWRKSRRLTLVNGQVAPTIVMRPGEVQRWRIIHAGTRENVSLKLEGHALNEIAADGIALGRRVAWTQPMLMAPGYRSDVLVQAQPLPVGSAQQVFDLVDEAIPAAQTLQGQQAGDTVFLVLNRIVGLDSILRWFSPKPRQVLAHLIVSGEPVEMALPNGEDLQALAPFKVISDAELTDAPQRLTFDVIFASCDQAGNCNPGRCLLPVLGCKVAYTINGREFNESHVRKLKLGAAGEWTLDAGIAIHPFHIHINPFQVSRLEPDGARHLIWKDTLQVSAGDPPTKIRMRYSDFMGTTVLHCHILDHEDQGMMETVSIER